MSSYGAYLVETFVTLAGVCAIAAVVLWTARRLGVARTSGPIALRGRLALDARRAIYLVEVGDRVFVLGVGEGGFTKLGELPVGDLPDPDEARQGARFSDVLSRVLARSGASKRQDP